jgi:polysaccharide chain length determinant protein (PEP-CTERM system associated)
MDLGGDGKDAASRIAELSAQLQQAQLQLKEAENARDAAKKQLAEEAGQGQNLALRSLMQESELSVSTPEIDARIEALKRNLDGLLQRYTEQHPDVVQARRLLMDLEAQRTRELAELRKAAMAKASAGGGPVSATSSLAMQELSRMVATSEVQVAALRARVNEFGARLAAARVQMRTAPQIEAEAAQLNRDYAVTKKNYEDLVARRQAAVMSGELDVASGVAEFRLVDPPRVAPKPVAPNRVLLVPLAMAAALAAGLGFAFAASQLRPTFGDATELRAKTGLPLLGVVTAVVSELDMRRERASLFRWVTASGGLVGLFVAGMIAMVVMNRFGA